MMRRYLVLTNETASHPFRAALPPRILQSSVDDVEPSVPFRQSLAADVRGFMQAYCACLFAVTAFIA